MADLPLTELSELRGCALSEVKEAADEGALDEVARVYLGRKGRIRALMKVLGTLDKEQRPRFGQAVNALSGEVEAALEARKAELAALRRARRLEDPFFDPTLPGEGTEARTGTLHPLSLVDWRLDEIFKQMGFYVLDYPEVETELTNFEALNIPADHPARDMQDTFWLEDGRLLRTHTSTGQVRTMLALEPPFRAIFPGRVFRYEATDASHEHTFHQVEGLYVDRDVSVANLIASMKTLLTGIFGRRVRVRLRPGYFPFVEPGFELDISCLVCGAGEELDEDGEPVDPPGCSVCKHSGWVELLPCGLVHPNVLRAGGLDPGEWQGWAFGLGLSRLVMMRYQLDDIRLLLSGDVRFLRQFKGTGLE